MASVHDSIVRKHLLSEREKSAKDKLFKKGNQPGKSTTGGRLPDEALQTVRRQSAEGPIDKQIEGFMREMTTEVKKMNSGMIDV